MVGSAMATDKITGPIMKDRIAKLRLALGTNNPAGPLNTLYAVTTSLTLRPPPSSAS